ncbi:MAG TPA: hypothetical protein VFZ25_12675, partial [Chloroflexota bacterium]|nr:hypothetical protein [Chloroflexota bacterium]
DARTAWIVALANAGQTAAPSQPRLASTADAGKTWASADSPCPGSEQGFTFNSASEGWLFCRASSGLQVYRTTDTARTWQPLGLIEPSNPTAATALTLAGVTRLSDQVAVAALNDGTIAITRDGGKSWKQALAAGEPLQGVERHGAADVWVLGNRQIYRSADAGQTWTTQTLDYHPA